MVPVPGYPRKLVLFKMEASGFWQVRCWVHGKSYRRSSRSKSVRVAQEWAKQLYESLLALRPEPDQPAASVTWLQAAQQLLEHEQARVRRGDFAKGSWQVLRNRLTKTLNPLWGSHLLQDLGARQMMELVHRMSQYSSPTTVHQHLVIVRKVLALGKRMGWLSVMPDVPSIKIKGHSRGAFNATEYDHIARESRRLVGCAHPLSQTDLRLHMRLRQSDVRMPVDLSWAIRLLVNGFMRPSDLKYLRHQHVEVVLSGARSYLRLTLPETKGHGTPIVTMPAAVHVYRQILRERANCCAPSDFLLLPHISDRDHALKVLGVHFNWVLQNTGLKRSPTGTLRSLYSLRHSAITFRLLYGSGMDLLTLARNARTSVQMIERYYASTLRAEQNIAMLHSRRAGP
jgi:integrase